MDRGSVSRLLSSVTGGLGSLVEPSVTTLRSLRNCGSKALTRQPSPPAAALGTSRQALTHHVSRTPQNLSTAQRHPRGPMSCTRLGPGVTYPLGGRHSPAGQVKRTSCPAGFFFLFVTLTPGSGVGGTPREPGDLGRGGARSPESAGSELRRRAAGLVGAVSSFPSETPTSCKFK